MAAQAIEFGAGFLAPEIAEPTAPTLHDGRHTGDGLNIVHQRRFTPEPAFGGVWRSQPWHAAPAFERLDERGFFAADIGTLTRVQMEFQIAEGAARFKFCDRFFHRHPRDFEFAAQV